MVPSVIFDIDVKLVEVIYKTPVLLKTNYIIGTLCLALYERNTVPIPIGMYVHVIICLKNTVHYYMHVFLQKCNYAPVYVGVKIEH